MQKDLFAELPSNSRKGKSTPLVMTVYACFFFHKAQNRQKPDQNSEAQFWVLRLRNRTPALSDYRRFQHLIISYGKISLISFFIRKHLDFNILLKN